ncbi:hypothetical protein AMJ57_00345 [Parcubacteria bacterium SG8_24]|nr:MAG: hypothetical protein AMJ57_00345 [Parcubacteria bacterium SG8_24]
MGKKVLVTGGAGFIGSHVVDRLLDRGYEVRVIDDLSTGRKGNVRRPARLHVADIRSKKAAALIRRLQPTHLVHLAAHIDLRRSVDEPMFDADVNIMGSLNILQAALGAGVRHLTFASSAAVYTGADILPTPESAPTRPGSPYGCSKLSFEHYLHSARLLHDLSAAALRFSNVYGPRQTVKGEAGAVAIFLNNLLAGRPVTINGDGEQTRDFIFATDVAAAVVVALEAESRGTFNISTGIETSINDLYRFCRRASGSRLDPSYGAARPGDDRRVSLDPSRAKQELSWTPRVGIEEGVTRTHAWMSGDRSR